MKKLPKREVRKVQMARRKMTEEVEKELRTS
jgi:hypothetical protein